MIQEDDKEYVDSPVPSKKELAMKALAGSSSKDKSNSFFKIVSTPSPPRKLDSSSSATTLDKLTNFKNLLDHSKKSDNSSSMANTP